jgi:hypothetical protein
MTTNLLDSDLLLDTTTAARTAHDLGLAAWFGGGLLGAAALNPASGEVEDRTDRLRVANAAWGRWMPLAAAAIGAHLVGGAKLTTDNAGRLLGQEGVASASALKTGLTAAALAATAASGWYGKKVMKMEAGAASTVEVEDATTPAASTPEELAAAQRTLKVLQWAVPALTGGMLAVSAVMGEQQRPQHVTRGLLGRIIPGL